MRLLILTHRRDDPSYRVRWARHEAALVAAGIAVETRECASEPRRRLWEAARASDVTVLHRRLFRGMDRWRLRRAARRLVYDFDDALCYRPVAPHRSAGRQRRLFATVAAADLVLAGNRVLAGLARLRARAVRVVPSTVTVAPQLPPRERLAAPTAVWIGQRATLPHLETVRAAVLATGWRLRVIADEAPPGVDFVPWTLAGEHAALAACHVGLMPLPRDPFARGKCGYKLLQYYAAGLPAITSPVGVNRALADGGALVARTPADFGAALERLRDPALRAALATKGRAFVAARYAAGAAGERLARLLQHVAVS